MTKVDAENRAEACLMVYYTPFCGPPTEEARLRSSMGPTSPTRVHDGGRGWSCGVCVCVCVG